MIEFVLSLSQILVEVRGIWDDASIESTNNTSCLLPFIFKLIGNFFFRRDFFRIRQVEIMRNILSLHIYFLLLTGYCIILFSFYCLLLSPSISIHIDRFLIAIHLWDFMQRLANALSISLQIMVEAIGTISLRWWKLKCLKVHLITSFTAF